MFARDYADHTVDEEAILQLRVPLRPNWFGPVVTADYHSEALPLWLLVQQLNFVH